MRITVQCVGHMNKNLRVNHNRGRRFGKPRLRGRGIGAVLAYIHETKTLPTLAMFDVAWTTTLARMEHVWLDKPWVRYFRRQYLRTFRYRQRTYLHATWHHGVLGVNKRGHPASQQSPEQGHATMKRGVRSVKNGTLQEVVEELGNSAIGWTSPPVDEEKSLSLMATGDRLGLYPTGPDAWMEQDGLIVQRPGSWTEQDGHLVRTTVHLPSIPTILAAAAAAGDANDNDASGTADDASPVVTIPVVRVGVTYYVMAIGPPRPIPKTLARNLVDQLRTNDSDTTRDMWIGMGILVAPLDAADAAPRKLGLSRLRETWGDCVTRAATTPKC